MTASVRAKFRVSYLKKIHTGGDPQGEVELTAVSGKDGDNASWSKWTPTGKITMTITNPAAYNVFDPGREFYIDFTPADAVSALE
jgi:hypothetical protein